MECESPSGEIGPNQFVRRAGDSEDVFLPGKLWNCAAVFWNEFSTMASAAESLICI